MRLCVPLSVVCVCLIGGCAKRQTRTIPKVTEFIECPSGTAAFMKHLGGDRYSMQISDATHTGQFPDIDIDFEAGSKQHGLVTLWDCKTPARWSALLKHRGGTQYSMDIVDPVKPTRAMMVLKFDTHYPWPPDIDRSKSSKSLPRSPGAPAGAPTVGATPPGRPAVLSPPGLPPIPPVPGLPPVLPLPPVPKD